MTKPTPISERAVRRQMAPDLEQIVEKCRGHRRHRQKERELGGRPPIEPHQHAADDRGARSRHARNQCQRLEHADRHGPAHRDPLRLAHRGLRPNRSTASITTPPTMNATAMVAKLSYSTRLTKSARNAPATRGRDERRAAPPPRNAGSVPGVGQSHHHSGDSLAIQPHHSQNRTELNHHREHTARVDDTRGRGCRSTGGLWRISAETPSDPGGFRAARLERVLAFGNPAPVSGSPSNERRTPKPRAQEARALRCGFDLRVGCCGAVRTAPTDAGACDAARVGDLPRQIVTIAAATKMLE